MSSARCSRTHERLLSTSEPTIATARATRSGTDPCRGRPRHAPRVRLRRDDWREEPLLAPRGRTCLIGDLDRDLGWFLGCRADGTPRPTAEHLLAAVVQATRRLAVDRRGFGRSRSRRTEGCSLPQAAASPLRSAFEQPTPLSTRRSSSLPMRAHGRRPDRSQHWPTSRALSRRLEEARHLLL